VIVWALAFLVAILGAGLVVEHYHPSWLDPVRHIVSAPAQSSTSVGGTSGSTQPASNRGSGSDKMVKISQTATAVTYSVPASHFTLSISTTQRCYVVVKSLATGTDLFASTIGAGTTQSVVVTNGSATVQAFAAGSALVISSSGRHLGTVAELKYATTYTFQPTNT
jgi:hypothetical protein